MRRGLGSLLFSVGSLVLGFDRWSSKAFILECRTVMMQSLAATLGSSVALHRRGDAILRRGLVNLPLATVRQLRSAVTRRRRCVTDHLFTGREHRWPGILRRTAISRRSRAVNLRSGVVSERRPAVTTRRVIVSRNGRGGEWKLSSVTRRRSEVAMLRSGER